MIKELWSDNIIEPAGNVILTLIICNQVYIYINFMIFRMNLKTFLLHL